METEAKRKSINELHPDTRILINYLASKIKDNQTTFSYLELSNVIGGKDIQDKYRGLLVTAIKHVQFDRKVMIDTVRNVGIKVTDDFVGVMDSTIKHIRRSAKRKQSVVLNAVNSNNLDNETKVKICSRISIFGAISQFTKQQKIKQIEGKLGQTQTLELSTAETIKLFE